MKPERKEKPSIFRRDGLFYHPCFVRPNEKNLFLDWLSTLHPIWEMRYSENNPPPETDEQRQLLRPVYWLGNWQFACLNYYHPPHGITNRCIRAENYPDFIKQKIDLIENIVRSHFNKNEIPKKWKLNTCLINFYGSIINEDGKKIDTARVGDHKDFEPGPIASLSFGNRAFFQFVQGKNIKNNIIHEQWIGDSSLFLFGNKLYKELSFHRVQRVDKKLETNFKLNIENFETRRINLTFRYVPEEHIIEYKNLPLNIQSDILPYMQELAIHSNHFKQALDLR